jgi:hypothetical protein
VKNQSSGSYLAILSDCAFGRALFAKFFQILHKGKGGLDTLYIIYDYAHTVLLAA